MIVQGLEVLSLLFSFRFWVLGLGFGGPFVALLIQV
jgi:hypothetical protein